MRDVDLGIRSVRVVTLGVILALLTFGAVCAVVRRQGAIELPDGARDGLLLVAGLVAVGAAATYVVLSRRAQASIRQAGLASRSAAEPLEPAMGAYRQLVIVRSALAEAPGLLGLVAYLAGGSELALLLPAASVAVLLGTIPSRAELERLVSEG